MTKPTHVNKFTPDTIEWKAALSVELLLLKTPVHYVATNGTARRARYLDTEINTDLAPVFVFIDIETKKAINLTLENVCQLASGKPD